MRELLAAFALVALAFCLPTHASAQAAPGFSFSDTTWTYDRDGVTDSTIQFNADGSWTELWRQKHETGRWQANPANNFVTVTRSDGRIFHYRLRPDHLLIRDVGRMAYQLAAGSAAAGVAAAPAPAPASPTAPASASLPDNQSQAVVLVKGDNAEGTGFLVKTKDGPAVITNIHVISNNPNLRITTNTGTPLTILSYKGATDRDLVMIAIQDGNYTYLSLAADVGNTAHTGDAVITPGNSEGGEVILNTSGTVLGLGPDRVEFSNPIYHGNSGGPVFHVKSGQVIGVVTEAMKVDLSDALDKNSFASRDSAIRSSMRYFGLRLDNVPQWEPYDWKRFQSETAFLDQFDKLSRCLDSYLNTETTTASSSPSPDNGTPKKKKRKKQEQQAPQQQQQPQSGGDDQADDLWMQNDKLLKATNDFKSQITGYDTSQQMDALRELFQTINGLADTDLAAIQNPNNFYTFNQQRAKDELAYRKALKQELDAIGTNVSRLTSLPRTNQ